MYIIFYLLIEAKINAKTLLFEAGKVVVGGETLLYDTTVCIYLSVSRLSVGRLNHP